MSPCRESLGPHGLLNFTYTSSALHLGPQEPVVSTVASSRARAVLGRWQGVVRRVLDWGPHLSPPASPSNLLANPFNCNCQLAWLGDWLRKRKIVTGNPRCQNPDFLRQIPLQDVAFPDFRCEEGDLVG